MLRVDAGGHLQVPRRPPSLASADATIPCGCVVGTDNAVEQECDISRPHQIDGKTCLLLVPHRPSCYYCGEGGHTAAECSREKPIAVRNERQPGYSERSVAASYYGYGDDYGGAQGCVGPAA